MSKFDVFISYSSKDVAIAEKIATRLTDGGAKVWFDQERIRTGARIRKDIGFGLEHSERVFALMSPSYLKRKGCCRELEWALERWREKESPVPLFALHELKRKHVHTLPTKLKSKARGFLEQSMGQGSKDERRIEEIRKVKPLSQALLRALRINEPRVAAAVCVRRGAQGEFEFLLVHDGTRERWHFPKGRIKDGELPREAAARELLEEAGVTAAHRADLGDYGHGGASRREVRVHAFLFEWKGSEEPEEPWRKPKWRTLTVARERLARQRRERHARQLQELLETAAEQARKL